jgi:hypothetical protein
MYTKSSAALCVLALALSACSGGQGFGPAAVPASPSNAASQRSSLASQGVRGDTKLEVRLAIPHKKRRTHYVSPSTQSFQIKEGKTVLGTFDTMPTSKGCLQQDGMTVCSFSMGAIPGAKQPFSVATYDGTHATGSLLSETSMLQTIVASKANAISLTLNGVPAAIALQLSNANPTQDTPASLTLTVTATDADSNVIIGPGGYAHSIAINDSDTSGATKLSATTVTSPSNNVLTITYNGDPVTATFTGSATGVTNATATLVSVKPHSQDVGGVWAAIPGTGSVSYYNGTASPSLTLSSTALTTATAVAVDDTGRVIAGDANGNINVWPIDASGTATPAQSITGAGNITALAWDPVNGRIIYAAQNSSSFCVVAANASGAASGVSTCYSAPTYLLASTVSGLAVNPNNGTLYVANATPVGSGNGSGDCPLSGPNEGTQSCANVLTFTLGSNGAYNYASFMNLQDCTNPQWRNEGQLAFDPTHSNGDGTVGVLWIADPTPNQDTVYGVAADSAGCNITVAGYFTGDGASLVAPLSVAWDGGTGVWVGDQSTTFLQHWTNVYASPTLPTGNSFYLGPNDGNASPTNIAVFNVVAPAAKHRTSKR